MGRLLAGKSASTRKSDADGLPILLRRRRLAARSAPPSAGFYRDPAGIDLLCREFFFEAVCAPGGKQAVRSMAALAANNDLGVDVRIGLELGGKTSEPNLGFRCRKIRIGFKWLACDIELLRTGGPIVEP